MSAKEARPVHYASSGVRGVVFPCYTKESERRRAGPRRLVGAINEPGRFASGHHEYELPEPKHSTNLLKVTCPVCWRHIFAIAEKVLMP